MFFRVEKKLMLILLGMFFLQHNAFSAVTCVENKNTGRFESKSARGGVNDCDVRAVRDGAIVGSIVDAENHVKGGTQIIGGTIVTNAERPFDSVSSESESVNRKVLDSLPPIGNGATVENKDKLTVAVKSVPIGNPDEPDGGDVALQSKTGVDVGDKKVVISTTKYKFETTDLSFKQALTRWAKIAGWQVSWEAEKDFPGRIFAEFSDDFEKAVAEATRAYRNSDYPLKACGYDNKVIRVVRYLGTGQECKLEIN